MLPVSFSLALLLAAFPAESSQPSAGHAHVARAVVKLIDDVEVPAEEAGRMMAVHVCEGDRVEEGKTILAQLEDSRAAAAMRIATADYKAAQEKAQNDINVRFAKAAANVAQADLEANREANRRVPGTRPAIEMKKLELTYNQAALQIEQAEHEQLVAMLEADAGAAKLEAAQVDLRRRQLIAPLNGEVVEIRFRPGEWVQPGDKVLRVIRLDRLRIEGSVNARDYTPADIANRPVTVRVKLSRGREEVFTGQVVFVSPIVQFGGDFQVLAEVTNRRDGAGWLLRPGIEADLLIDTSAAAASTARRP
ncbi:MAG: HlyD family efflux transporter periplasmic adaptor subunit [Planctomycetes bacterium]|nr:HlyD family efflux transporter periplasmic adaptor subunit [Planctomycetota bacterium]